MKWYSILGIAFLTLCLNACNLLPSSDGNVNSIKWVPLNGNGFALSIPDYLSAMEKDINPEAEIIYGNVLKEVYVMVITEPIADVDEAFALGVVEGLAPGLDGYAQFVGENIKSTSSEVKSFSPMLDGVTNGLNCKVFEVEAKVEDVDVYYAVNVVKGQSSYYQIYSWTLLDQKDKFKDVLNKIRGSFQENK